jgi:hypothetical protein
MFLIRIFFEFFDRTDPFSTRAKPAYIRRIIPVETIMRRAETPLSASYLVEPGCVEFK